MLLDTDDPSIASSFAGTDVSLASPRRSTRIKESPSIDYAKFSRTRNLSGQSNDSTSGRSTTPIRRTKSPGRSKNQVLRTSHGISALHRGEPSPLTVPTLNLNQHSTVTTHHSTVTTPPQSTSHPHSSTRGLGTRPMASLDLQSEDEDIQNTGFCQPNHFKERVSEKVTKVIERMSLMMIGLVGARGMKFLQSREGKFVAGFIALVFILLLLKLLLVFIQAIGVVDRTVVLVSAVFSPFLQVGEAARLGVMSLPEVLSRREVQFISPLDHAQTALDYDLLAAKILDSAKFQQLVNKLAARQGERVREQVEGDMKEQLGRMEEMKAMQEESYFTLDKTMAETKLGLEAELAKIVISVQEQLTGMGGKTDIKTEDLLKVEGDLNKVKKDWDVLSEKVKSLEKSSDYSRELAVIDDLKLRVSRLSDDFGVLKTTDISKCCKSKEDLLASVDSKVYEAVSSQTDGLKEWVSQNHLNISQINSRLDELRREIVVQAGEGLKEAATLEAKYQAELSVNSQMEAWRDELEKHMASKMEEKVNHQALANVENEVGEGKVGEIVRKALTKYDADKTGLFDFALETAGGSILATKCTETYQLSSAVMSVMGFPFWWETNSPRIILQPGAAPGQCWAFTGSHGTVVIRLSAAIHVSGISVEHIPRLLSPDGNITSAPHKMSLYAVKDPLGLDLPAPLLNFTYSSLGDPVQTFLLTRPTVNRYDTVEITVNSNHGHSDYTCLYRIRIHGNLENSDSLH